MDLGGLLGKIDPDTLGDAARLIAKHKDKLALLDQLPELFAAFGEGLDRAGDEARDAARALIGEDGESGVRGTLKDASGALADIATSLAAGIDKLADAAEAVGKVPMMDGPAKRFSGAAADMGRTTDKMAALSESMVTIADTLQAVGKALDGLGSHLGESGHQARGLLAAAPKA